MTSTKESILSLYINELLFLRFIVKGVVHKGEYDSVIYTSRANSHKSDIFIIHFNRLSLKRTQSRVESY